MNALTQSIAIRGVDLSDRLVMPPMASGKPNPDGTVSDSLVEYYKEKSQGGYLGLVITEHAFVCQQGKAHGGQLSIAREEDIPGLRRLADAIHNNRVKAVAQISHAGGAANPQDTGMEPVSASAVQSPRAKAGAPLPRAMTVGEIQAVVEAFAQAACRAQEAGFDGVELHAAHGYLLNQFYSPLTNHRTDAYTGATLAGRLRFLLEAVEAVRAAVGQEFWAPGTIFRAAPRWRTASEPASCWSRRAWTCWTSPGASAGPTGAAARSKAISAIGARLLRRRCPCRCWSQEGLPSQSLPAACWKRARQTLSAWAGRC